MSMEMKSFLEALESKNENSLNEAAGSDKKFAGDWSAESKAWIEGDPQFKGFKWAYKPDKRRVAIIEMKEDGEAKDSWIIASVVETVDDEDEEDLEGATLRGKVEDSLLIKQGPALNEAVESKLETGRSAKMNFFDAVKKCIDIVEKDRFKEDASPAVQAKEKI